MTKRCVLLKNSAVNVVLGECVSRPVSSYENVHEFVMAQKSMEALAAKRQITRGLLESNIRLHLLSHVSIRERTPARLFG